MSEILRGTAATLSVTWADSNGEPVAADGDVTVTVVDAGGTVVLNGAAAAAGATTGVYTVAVPASATSKVTVLTATWTDGQASWVTFHEVVGGFLFSLTEARAASAALDDDGRYPAADLIRVRSEVTAEAEWICGTPLVVRYRRLVVDGAGGSSLLLGIPDVTAIRSVVTVPSAGSSSSTTFTAGQLAALVVGADNSLTRTDGGVFPDGAATVTLEVECGRTDWRDDLRRAVLTRFVDVAAVPQGGSAIPLRAKSYTSPDGYGWELTDQDEFTTGIPAVDAVYGRYSRRSKPGAAAPVAISRTISYDPQYNALFAGGHR